MTEGTITGWKLRGDTFSAGDVLLEMETDTAQMDVEALAPRRWQPRNGNSPSEHWGGSGWFSSGSTSGAM